MSPLRSRRWNTRWASSGSGRHDRRPRRGRMLDERSSDRSGAVEAAGAAVFFHQCSADRGRARTGRYGLPNTIGNLTDRAITFGTLVFGGVMDEFPDLKICLGHAGGYMAYGVARMDKGWRAGALEDMPEFEDVEGVAERAQRLLGRFYYDSCTYTEESLRFLLTRSVRSGGARYRLSGADDPGRRGELDQRAGEPHGRREGRDLVAEPSPAARVLRRREACIGSRTRR